MSPGRLRRLDVLKSDTRQGRSRSSHAGRGRSGRSMEAEALLDLLHESSSGLFVNRLVSRNRHRLDDWVPGRLFRLAGCMGGKLVRTSCSISYSAEGIRSMPWLKRSTMRMLSLPSSLAILIWSLSENWVLSVKTLAMRQATYVLGNALQMAQGLGHAVLNRVDRHGE